VRACTTTGKKYFVPVKTNLFFRWRTVVFRKKTKPCDVKTVVSASKQTPGCIPTDDIFAYM
jgi:hypothetical protein